MLHMPGALVPTSPAPWQARADSSVGAGRSLSKKEAVYNPAPPSSPSLPPVSSLEKSCLVDLKDVRNLCV